MTAAERMRAIRERRRAAGLCCNCSGELDRDGSRCTACNKRHSEITAKRRESKKQAGQCVSCPKAAVEGKTECRACAKISSTRTAREAGRRIAQWREQGLCTRCGRRRPKVGYATCRVCLLLVKVQVAARKEARLFEAGNHELNRL